MPSLDNALLWLSAAELRALFLARQVSPTELVAALRERIAAIEPIVNAFSALCLDEADASARAAERAYGRGVAVRPLEGIPVAVKDFFDTAGVQTAVGSSILRGRIPSRDSEVVRRLRAAGALVIGKTATHEFGWGITTDSPHFGPTHNPWALDRVPGGSSGGSAVALAAGLVTLAVGSDTGGSIRIPAAFCGVVGMKPTWGRVSCDGAFPLAPSLDHPGSMARTPGDARRLLDVLAGDEPPATKAARTTLRGTCVGVCPDLMLVPLRAAQRAAYDAAEQALRELGAQVTEVRLEHTDRIVPTFATIQQAEALHSHRRAGFYPARRDEYGADVRARLDGAQAVTLDSYLDAQNERRHIARRFARLFEQIDVLMTPVSSTSPVLIGETAAPDAEGGEHPLRDLVMPYTVPQDLLGLPACAVRAGFDELGVPVAVQITGAFGRDDLVLETSGALYAATASLQRRWPHVHPPPGR